MAKPPQIIIVMSDKPHADGQHVTVTATTLIGGKIVGINIVTMTNENWERVRRDSSDGESE